MFLIQFSFSMFPGFRIIEQIMHSPDRVIKIYFYYVMILLSMVNNVILRMKNIDVVFMNIPPRH